MKKVISLMGIFFVLSTGITANCESPDVVELLKDEVRFTQNWETDCSDTTIQISYEDAQRLMKIATAEGGNQGTEGMLLIMQTIWNRVQSDDFPDTIKGVIEQKNAFTSVTRGTYQEAEPTYEAHLALAEFEKNLNHDPKLIGFETTKNGERLLAYFDYYKTYQDHTFYQKKKD